MRFYVEMAIEYEAVSEPKALIAAQNIANAAESIFLRPHIHYRCAPPPA